MRRLNTGDARKRINQNRLRTAALNRIAQRSKPSGGQQTDRFNVRHEKNELNFKNFTIRKAGTPKHGAKLSQLKRIIVNNERLPNKLPVIVRTVTGLNRPKPTRKGTLSAFSEAVFDAESESVSHFAQECILAEKVRISIFTTNVTPNCYAFYSTNIQSLAKCYTGYNSESASKTASEKDALSSINDIQQLHLLDFEENCRISSKVTHERKQLLVTPLQESPVSAKKRSVIFQQALKGIRRPVQSNVQFGTKPSKSKFSGRRQHYAVVESKVPQFNEEEHDMDVEIGGCASSSSAPHVESFGTAISRPNLQQASRKLSTNPSFSAHSDNVQLFTVFVSNLQPTVDQDDMKQLFQMCGLVKSVRMLGGGRAEVVYFSKAKALKAIESYHKRELDGVPMRCELVLPATEGAPTAVVPDSTTGTGAARPSGDPLKEDGVLDLGRSQKPKGESIGPTIQPDRDVFNEVFFGSMPSRPVVFTVKV